MRRIWMAAICCLLLTLLWLPAQAGRIGDDTIEKKPVYTDGIYAACGILVPGTECLLFWPLDDSAAYALENYGEFGAFDTVFVAGTLQNDCVNICQEGEGCIVGNSITSCDINNQVFHGCGMLVQDSLCLLFNPDSSDQFYMLTHYDGFQPGERVFVIGVFANGCGEICPSADGCLINYQIGPCEDNGFPPGTIAVCGTLQQIGNCLLFVTSNTSDKYVLDNYGAFQAGDSVYVAGVLDPDCPTECEQADGCIKFNLIMPCENGQPLVRFEGCGILVQGLDCVLFQPLMDLSKKFSLSDYGGFQIGDSVYVSGDIYPFDSLCTGSWGTIAVSTITTCGGGYPGDSLAVCGVVLDTAGCLVFNPLGTSLYYQVDIATFAPMTWDTVFVTAFIDYNCTTTCAWADGCLFVLGISPCDIPEPPYFSGCGVLVETIDCILFQALNSPETLYQLATYGSFQVGDSVFVEGPIYPVDDTGCLEAQFLIFNQTISPCQTPPPIFDACGILVQSECLLFIPLNVYDSAQFTLTNYGEFQAGDTVYVQGYYVGPDTLCPESFGLIDNYLIDECGVTPPPNFQGCGVLVQTDCLMFEPLDMPNTFYLLTNYGGFGEGDTVYVEGPINGPDSICLQVIGIIDNYLIEPCQTPPPPAFSGCGVLVMYECLMFKPLDIPVDTVNFTLTNYGGFGEGDTVYVEGYFAGPDTICVESSGLIDNYLIEPCQGPPPPPAFSGCGVLVMYECLMFKPLEIQVDTVNFTLTNYGGFGEGDTVYVEGYFVGPDTVCVESVGLIDNYLIQPCDTLPGIFYEGCGILVESLDCLLFQPFPNTIGGLNVLLVLDNFGTFGIGDTVYVTGDIEWNCHDSCWGADGCIYGNTIADCENEPEPPIIAVCGLLLDLQGCLTFEPFTYCDSLFLLTNYGNFGAGDTVFVEGTIEPLIDTCGPATALIDNSLIWLCRPDCTLVIPIVDVQNVRHYPNPFNPSATIYFELTAPMKVSLTIYNILGQKVETLIDNQLLSGPQQVMWDGSRYASGIYLYQIRTEKEVITRKMSLSK